MRICCFLRDRQYEDPCANVSIAWISHTPEKLAELAEVPEQLSQFETFRNSIKTLLW